MFVLVVARQHEEQSAGEGVFSFGRWLHIIVRISTQGHGVCVGGGKTR